MSTESIKVCARFRRDNNNPDLVDEWDLDKLGGAVKHKDKTWTYDYILDNNSDQEEMYDKVAKQTITDFIHGYNGTIFAYGQSGSGKTFSMLGPDDVTEALKLDFKNIPIKVQELYGITPRATIQLFEAINLYVSQGSHCSLMCSYIEIYNETINCLLSKKENLKIREQPGVGMNVADKVVKVCKTPEEIFEAISLGTKNRAVSSTGLNSRSSRSHTVLMIEFEYNGVDGVKRFSRLNLVDLAGSERLSKTGADKEIKSLKEAQKINQSLTTLGMCIMALTTSGSKHVPYRNSKLTLILKESLGGNSKTTLLCTTSRLKEHSEESIQTLHFASRAKAIKNNCKANVQLGVKELQHLVDNMKKEILILRGQLKKGGLTYNLPLDSKLLALIGNSEFDIEGEDHSDIGVDADPKTKRQSIINLTEQEIVIKYCELRAKYDNLLETAGTKIYQLSNQQKNEFDSEIIDGIRNETDIKLQEIINDKNAEIQGLFDRHEAAKTEFEVKEEDYKLKLQDATKEKMQIEDDLNNVKNEMKCLQEMFDLSQNDISNFLEKISKKKKKNGALKQEHKSLKSDLTTASELLDEKTKHLSESETRNLELKQKFEEIQNKNDLLSLELENSKNLLKKGEEAEEALKSKLKELQDEINKHIEIISSTEKKFSDLTNRFNELEVKSKSDIDAWISKDAYSQSMIENLKQENEKLNHIVQDKITGQEVFLEKEKILFTAKATLEKKVEELLQENAKIKEEISETFIKTNNEKSELVLLNDSLSRELKSKAGELDNANFEIENIKKTNEERIKSETQKIEQLQSRIDTVEKKGNEFESANLVLIENERKVAAENKLLEKDIREKLTIIEELTESKGKLISANDKLERESKDLKQQLETAVNKTKEDSENEKKLQLEISHLKSDLEYKSKKIEDTEKKVDEVKAEKKILQDLNQRISDRIHELEIDNTRTKRVSKILEKEINVIKEKTPISKNIFGVSLKKAKGEQNKNYIKEAIQETKEIKKKTDDIYHDKLDELKGLRENIICLSPKTVSSRSDIFDLPELDFQDEDFFIKAEHILLEKERLYQEEKEKKQKTGMII